MSVRKDGVRQRSDLAWRGCVESGQVSSDKGTPYGEREGGLGCSADAGQARAEQQGYTPSRLARQIRSRMPVQGRLR